MINIKNNNAFTIVEIIIVVTIISVLSALAVTTYTGTRQDARDAARYGNATIISEGLEKYYEKNGEYPSVASISNSNSSNTGQIVAEKLSIPVDSLVMPKMPSSTTNGITTGDPANDYIAYIGHSDTDNNACQNNVNAGCDSYVLRYKEENGNTKEIVSRRVSRDEDNHSIGIPDLTVVASNATTINASWTSVPGATSYTLQRSTSSSMSSPTAGGYASTSTSATGLTADTTYYFRVRANTSSGSGDWSDIESATTNGIASPTGTLTISASMSGTNAVGTAGGGSCAAGTTIERQIRYQSTSTATAGTWSSYTTGASRSEAASQGWQYTFQQRARCVSGSSSSGWVSSGTSSTFRSINTPAAPTVTTSTSGNTTTWTASITSCPTGTTAQYRFRSLRDGIFTTTAWSAAGTNRTPSWNTSSQGFQYTVELQTRCISTHATSSWSATGSASYLRPIAAPAAPTNFVYAKVNAYKFTWTWTTPTCGPGTQKEMQYDIYVYGVSGNPFWWLPWKHQGWLSDPQANGAWWPSPQRQVSLGATFTAPIERVTSDGPIPSGSTTRARAKYICVNVQTGRTSSYGPIGTSATQTIY